jgi:hypothetical protein
MRRSENVWARHAGLLAVSALLAAGNLAFFIWYRGTTQERERALEGRRAQLAKDVEAVGTEAARLSAQRNRLSEVSAAIAEFYENRVGPRRETLAPVVAEIHAVFRRVGVNPSQISYATAPVTDLPLTEMHISFTFKNDYGRFKELLSAFESDRRWIVVREVGLSRDTDVPGGVQVRMQLATYFSGELSPRPRAAAVKSAAR